MSTLIDKSLSGYRESFSILLAVYYTGWKEKGGGGGEKGEGEGGREDYTQRLSDIIASGV